jgi:hypothetical protein
MVAIQIAFSDKTEVRASYVVVNGGEKRCGIGIHLGGSAYEPSVLLLYTSITVLVFFEKH